MNDIERIYSLLLHGNGLKIRALSKELELDKYYVAEILFSPQNISYWYQDDDSLWFAKEGALQIEELEEEKDELTIPITIPQKFNISRFLDEDISDSLRSYLELISKYRLYSNDEMIELFKRYRNGDQKAFELIIKSQQRLVANIAFLYRRKGAPIEDLIQEGNVGLVKAAERFDFTQYRSFSNFAKTWILQSISMSLTTMPYIVRLPLNQLFLYRKIRRFKEKFEQLNGYLPSVNDIEIDEYIDTKHIKYLDGLPYRLSSLTSLSNDLDLKESETNHIEEYENRNESQVTVRNLLRYLKKREKQIIMRVYGIETKVEELVTIGEYFGLTRERVRQIKEKSLKHLREILQNKNGKDGEKEYKIQDYDDSENNLSRHIKPKKQEDRKEPEKIQHNVQEIDGIYEGDEIYYAKKYCTVRKIIKNNKSTKLYIVYANGVLDVVFYDKTKVEKPYCFYNPRKRDIHTEKTNQNYHLSTSLNLLVEEKILTRRQLRQCHKKKLKTIGDVKQIIEKYQLTPYSTRFTKYTLDMWFDIIGLLNKS